jgi:hypothetical protein
MSKTTTSGWRHRQWDQHAYDNALLVWRAQETYRARRAVHSVFSTLLLLEGLAFAGLGHWVLGLAVVTVQGLVGWGLAWGWRRLWRARRAWGRMVVLALVLLLGGALSGCEAMERGVAKLHGITVDPLPGPCAPESFQAGQCVKVKQEEGKP